jgi:molybdopterin synthase sulfur carrier subunit
MRVTVKLHATLKKYLPPGSSGDGIELEVTEGATVADVIERLGIPAKHAGMLVSEDEYLESTTVVRDGQEIDIFPPLAGGAN